MSLDFEGTEDNISIEDISPEIEVEAKPKSKNNLKWNNTMELEMAKAILKHKAHIVTATEKNVKWEQVFEALRTNFAFLKVFAEHEVSNHALNIHFKKIF